MANELDNTTELENITLSLFRAQGSLQMAKRLIKQANECIQKAERHFQEISKWMYEKHGK